MSTFDDSLERLEIKGKQLSLPTAHIFKKCGSNFLFDANTCACLKIDDLAYDLIYYLKHGIGVRECLLELATRYGESQVLEAIAEMEGLEEQGVLSFDPLLDPTMRKVAPQDVERVEFTNICLILAQKCNLRCRYCFAHGGIYGLEEGLVVSLNCLDEIGQQLRVVASSVECYTFNGGAKNGLGNTLLPQSALSVLWNSLL